MYVVQNMSTLSTKLHKILLSSFREVVRNAKMKAVTAGWVKNINPSLREIHYTGCTKSVCIIFKPVCSRLHQNLTEEVGVLVPAWALALANHAAIH